MNWPQFIASVITILVLFHAILGACAYLIFIERKVAAWCQDRIGPNRNPLELGPIKITGKVGIGQALADGLKLFVKEDYTPPHVDRVLFLLAPIIVVVPALLGWAVIPWGGSLQWGEHIVSIMGAPIDIGVIYILAIGSLAVYGVVVGGFASNNKYSFLGGLRATAQMLSYEIPMGLSVLIVILLAGTTSTEWLVNLQASSSVLLPGTNGHGGWWFIFYQPLMAVIFFTCILAECNRAPFDLAEAEQELVGGYHTEYSSMKWALFFLGEYIHMITGCAFFTLLFLGGWDAVPFFDELPLVGGIGVVLIKVGIFAAKVLFLLFLMMWIRWSLPRFRFDQLMRLAWRALIPMSLVLLLITGVMVYYHVHGWWWYCIANLLVLAGGAVLGPVVPQGPAVNRKVGLAGSRFSPAEA